MRCTTSLTTHFAKASTSLVSNQPIVITAFGSLETAIATALARGDLWWLPELYRQKSTLETPAARERSLRQALDTARAQSSRSLECRILASLATFVLFYLMTVFALSWGTTALKYSRATFLIIQLVGIVFFAGAVLFHLITLPVEFDASKRALAQLTSTGAVICSAWSEGDRSR